MALNPRIADLTAINEAISALDYVSTEETETAQPILEIQSELLAVRARLTERDWPEQAAKWIDREAFEQWHAEKATQQRKDGRQ